MFTIPYYIMWPVVIYAAGLFITGLNCWAFEIVRDDVMVSVAVFWPISIPILITAFIIKWIRKFNIKFVWRSLQNFWLFIKRDVPEIITKD